jgi:uncharacterized protein YjbJ (UPF0337 family)
LGTKRWTKTVSAAPRRPWAGTIKETAGKIVGDQNSVADGQAEKAEGKLQNALGGVKDAVREAVNKTPWVGSTSR